MIIKNREQLVNELAEIFLQFDKDCNSYQTDVYFYYDNRDQTGRLDTFVNVGGNSWLDDDHMTVYTDKEHYDDGAYSWYQSEDEIADVLEISVEQLLTETRQYHDMDDDEEPDYWEIEKYVQSVDSYNEKLWDRYYDFLKSELASEYEQRAEEIISEVENIPYFVNDNDMDEECLLFPVAGKDDEICKLNDYAEKYSAEHEVDIEGLKEIFLTRGF